MEDGGWAVLAREAMKPRSRGALKLRICAVGVSVCRGTTVMGCDGEKDKQNR